MIWIAPCNCTVCSKRSQVIPPNLVLSVDIQRNEYAKNNSSFLIMQGISQTTDNIAKHTSSALCLDIGLVHC